MMSAHDPPLPETTPSPETLDMADVVVVEAEDVAVVEIELETTNHKAPEDVIEAAPPEEMYFTFTPLMDELTASIRASCSLMPPAEVMVCPPGCVLPENYCNYARRIRDLEVREDDIWVVSFPKCGSRLTQEMVWLLGNSLDFEEAQRTALYKRFIFLEYIALWPEGADQPDTVSWVEDAPSPRFIKTHLPLELLPTQLWLKKPKVIYVGRNPKDTAIDYYTHYQQFYKYSGTQEQFFEAFYRDRVVFSPFWEHVLSFWEMRKESNILINTFEEMSQSLIPVIKRTASFLGVTVEPGSEARLLHYLHHGKTASSAEAVGEGGGPPETQGKNLLSLGKSGCWRTSMTPSCAEKFDRWTKEKLAGTDFSNVYMII